jgi:hypothetical protein
MPAIQQLAPTTLLESDTISTHQQASFAANLLAHLSLWLCLVFQQQDSKSSPPLAKYARVVTRPSDKVKSKQMMYVHKRITARLHSDERVQHNNA